MFEVLKLIAMVISIASGPPETIPAEPEQGQKAPPVVTEDAAISMPQLPSPPTPAEVAAEVVAEVTTEVVMGKFTTAGEIKPILTATKQGWVGLREYNGQDVLYFTQVLAWRCGLSEIRYSINNGAEKLFEMEPCHMELAQPNSLTLENHSPYLALLPYFVGNVTVTLKFDDGTEDSATYQRNQIMIP